MMSGSDHGSDTETDDELLERVEASRARAVKAQASHQHTDGVESTIHNGTEAAAPAPQGPPVGAMNRPAPTPLPLSSAVKSDSEEPAPSSGTVEVDGVVSAASHASPPRKNAAFLSLILNSDDDEPPRMPSPAPVRPPAPTLPAAPQIQAMSATEGSLQAHADTPMPLALAVDQKCEPAVLPPVTPTALPSATFEASASVHQPSTPLVTTTPMAVPLEETFVSPFASLAAAYQLPPPPVYGAPPASYVAGRSINAPSTSVHAVVPTERFVSPPPAPTAAQMQRVVPPRMPAAARVPSPTTSASPGPGAPRPGAKYPCPLCKETVPVVAPRTAADRMQCTCCLLVLSLSVFSKNQRRADHPSRRCGSCVKANPMPAKFKNIHRKHNPNDINEPHLTQRQRARLIGAANASHDGSLATSVANQFTAEQRREMELAVRDFKLAKRSIERRRVANDLRGSTRADYIQQLNEEDRKADEKMAKARRRNPALFDELNSNIKVKSVSVAPKDRDVVHKKKPKQPAKAKTAAKRTPAETDHSPRQQPAKRPRASPQTVAAPTVKKPKPEPVSPTDDESDTARPRRIATRARTRQAAKPVVVIDLVDSDSG